MLMRLIIAAMAIAFFCQTAQAGNVSGISFYHHDWEIACDNTGTCRAAGYQGDGEELALSVLLTRKAGAGEALKGQLMIGNYDAEERLKGLPSGFKAGLKINNKSHGSVFVNKDLTGDLSDAQVKALIGSLSRKSEIEFVFENHIWRLSDKGAAAVLLKMDEFQKRAGTVGALIRKGPKGEDKVLKGSPKPVIVASKIPARGKGERRLSADEAKALLKLLQPTIKEDDCEIPFRDHKVEIEITITPLTNAKSLVSTLCWMAAYNAGNGYWVVNDIGPKTPVLVTTMANEYANGEISSSHKGRGLGDCWSTNRWVWNGAKFIHAEAATSGMCKLVAPGGAWSLPTFVSEIRYK
jgi:hypothetical protein